MTLSLLKKQASASELVVVVYVAFFPLLPLSNVLCSVKSPSKPALI